MKNATMPTRIPSDPRSAIAHQRIGILSNSSLCMMAADKTIREAYRSYFCDETGECPSLLLAITCASACFSGKSYPSTFIIKCGTVPHRTPIITSSRVADLMRRAGISPAVFVALILLAVVCIPRHLSSPPRSTISTPPHKLCRGHLVFMGDITQASNGAITSDC